MNSILSRIQAAQKCNPVLQKAADGGPITEQSDKSAEVATDMVQGATNVPDVTKDDNTAGAAEVGKAVDTALTDEVTPAAPVTDNDSNPDVQEILNAAETVIKTANAMYPMAKAFSQMSVGELDHLFNKQAAATDLTNEQAFDLINKMASNGSQIATYFMDFCAGCDAVMQKLASDTEALVAQGVAPEEAEAMAAQALAGGMEGSPTADAPVSEEEVGAELESAVAEVTAEVAQEIMAESPEVSPEEAQAMAEELVINQLNAELGDMEATTAEDPGAAMMEQNASAEDVSADVKEDVSADVEDDVDADLENALQEIVAETAAEIIQKQPDMAPEEAVALAEELVTDQLASELAESGDMEESADSMEQTASAEDIEVPNEAADEAAAVIDELIMETAQEIKAASPEASDEEAIAAAEEAVMDAIAVAQEQEAIGAVDENGEYTVPDDVAAESVEDMAKTATANPLRDVLTPVVAELFGINQNAFMERITR